MASTPIANVPDAATDIGALSSHVLQPSGPDPDRGPTIRTTPLVEALLQFIKASRQSADGEVEGSVLRNPFSAQPIGTRLGTALDDTVTGQRVEAYRDPQSRPFEASFAVASDQATICLPA